MPHSQTTIPRTPARSPSGSDALNDICVELTLTKTRNPGQATTERGWEFLMRRLATIGAFLVAAGLGGCQMLDSSWIGTEPERTSGPPAIPIPAPIICRGVCSRSQLPPKLRASALRSTRTRARLTSPTTPKPTASTSCCRISPMIASASSGARTDCCSACSRAPMTKRSRLQRLSPRLLPI